MPVFDPRIAGKPVPRISKERIERECVARVKSVEALDVAFLDQRIPRHERDICLSIPIPTISSAVVRAPRAAGPPRRGAA